MSYVAQFAGPCIKLNTFLKFDSSEEKDQKSYEKSQVKILNCSVHPSLSKNQGDHTAAVAKLKPVTQVFTPITKSVDKKYLQFYKEIH